jgi:hypothetical protein
MTRLLRTIVAASVAMGAAGGSLSAQGTEGSKTAPAHDPSARLEKLLPPDVWQRVSARIAAARARELPAQALENRALKFAARGVKPEQIERAVAEHATRLEQAKQALEAARAQRPSNDEVAAGAEAIRMGASGADVSAIAKSAPRDRSLTVAFTVLTALSSHVPVDEALKRVQEQLLARASDAEIEKLPASLPAQAAEGKGRKPAVVGRDLAATKRPGAAGPPSGVPANGGSGVAPVRPPVQPPAGRP